MPLKNRSVLVVDPDAGVRQLVKRLVRKLGGDVVEAAGSSDTLTQLGLAHFDVIVADLHLTLADGTALLTAIERRQPGTPVVTLTASGSLSECVAAIRAGASDCLIKPFRAADLEVALDKAVSVRDRELERRRAREPHRHACEPLVGGSRRMQEVLRTIMRAARTDATVLITGETGTGKDVLAHLVHEASTRARGPLVAVNCGAIPEGLVESELFGHARGAFTGALERRLGVFAQASGGTLILDEIGELPLSAQVKLLRVLEEHAVTPVGEAHAIPVDVRVVAVTHRDLEALCAVGRFRDDLFFRLDVVRVEAPPLRARRDDIVLLTQHFLDAAARRSGRRLELAKETLAALVRYDWPGNVRELQNLIERMALLSTEDLLTADLLPPRVRAASGAGVPRPVRDDASWPLLLGGAIDLQGALDDIETRLIVEALGRAKGNRSAAARLLRINRTTLIERLRRKALN